MQTKRQEIFIDILGISVVFGNMETMGTELYIQSQLEQGSSVTACTWNDNGTIKFAYSDRLDIGVLAHEIVHIVNIIFNARGLKLDSNNDEFQAYLTGWLFKHLYDKIFLTV